MTAHWLPSSVMRCNNDIAWPDHSLMLSFHDLRGLPLRQLPPTVRQWFMTTNMAEPWQLAMLDDWQCKLLTSGEDTDLLPNKFVCFMLSMSVWHAKHSSVAFVRLSRSAVNIQLSHPSEQYWQDKWLVKFNLYRKTDGFVFFFRGLLALSGLSVHAPVWSLLPLLMFHLWCVCVHPRYLNWSTTSSVFPFNNICW